MNVDLCKLKELVGKLADECGQPYVSLKLEVNRHEMLGESIEWTCYTARSGHTRRYNTPEEALTDTRTACSDPGKLLAEAKALEAEARLLRRRIPKELGGEL